MLRSNCFLCGVIFVFVSYGPTWGRATSTLIPWCSKLNSTLVADDPLLSVCRHFNEAVERNATAMLPCLGALATSSVEHLVLLSYSSGHFWETVSILAGAGILRNAEDVAFLSGLHVNDRGSPAACNDIDGAHYCIARPAAPVSFGLCVPRSCDSASVSTLLGYHSSRFSEGRNTIRAKPLKEPLPPVIPSVVCGDESRLSVDVGTICTLVAVGCLVALSAIGTLLDHWYQHQYDSLTRKQSGVGDVRAAVIGDYHQIVPKAKSSIAPGTTSGGHGLTTREDLQGGRAQVPIPDDGRSLVVSHEGERKEHEEMDSSTLMIQYAETRGVREDRFLGPSEESVRDPLLGTRIILPTIDFRSRCWPLTQLVIKAGFEDPLWWRCLKCFSLRINVDKLFSPPPSPNKYGVLDGVRCMSMMWVVLGHVLIYSTEGAGLTNIIDLLPMDGHGVLSRFTAQIFPGAFFAVDSFFLMSGFLLSVVLLPRLKSSSRGNMLVVPMIYLHRYLRLTPMVASIVILRWQLFPLSSTGPTWWPAAATQKENCSKDMQFSEICKDQDSHISGGRLYALVLGWTLGSAVAQGPRTLIQYLLFLRRLTAYCHWWGELLYITNLFPWPPLGTGRCNPITWSLGNDMQFFLLGVPAVVAYSYRPRIVVVFLVLIMMVSWSYTLWIAYHEKLSFSIVISGSSSAWRTIYATPWCRCSVYIIGLLFGIGWITFVEERGILRRDQGPGSQAPNPHWTCRRGIYVAAAVVASALLLALPVYGSYGGYQDATHDRVAMWLDHLYLAFSRPTWALGVVLMCGLCFSGYGGLVNTFLTLPVWTALSRLTFGIFLTHTVVLDWVYYSGDTARDFSPAALSITFMGTLMGSTAFALVLHLLVEAPFRNLESLARRRLTNAGNH